jgi:hypothetical protein
LAMFFAVVIFGNSLKQVVLFVKKSRVVRASRRATCFRLSCFLEKHTHQLLLEARTPIFFFFCL